MLGLPGAIWGMAMDCVAAPQRGVSGCHAHKALAWIYPSRGPCRYQALHLH